MRSDPVTEDNGNAMSRPNTTASEAAPLDTPARPAPGGVQRSEGYLQRDGLRLYHCDWLPVSPRPRGSALLVVMHGYGEHCRRYDELAEYLGRRGHGVLRLDARGHGRSAGQRGHIDDYSEYVGDLQAFLAQVALRYPEHPRFLLGHSNGGLVAIRALQQGLMGLHGLVLTSPLLELLPRRKPVPEAVARWLSWALGRLPLPNGIHSRDLTHDEAIKEAHDGDPWVHRRATPRWYWSMTENGRRALADAAQVTLPLLAITGELDPIVDTRRVSEFCARVGSQDKRLVVWTGALHEVLNELDRRELFVLIADWIERVMAERLTSP